MKYLCALHLFAQSPFSIPSSTRMQITCKSRACSHVNYHGTLYHQPSWLTLILGSYIIVSNFQPRIFSVEYSENSINDFNPGESRLSPSQTDPSLGISHLTDHLICDLPRGELRFITAIMIRSFWTRYLSRAPITRGVIAIVPGQYLKPEPDWIHDIHSLSAEHERGGVREMYPSCFSAFAIRRSRCCTTKLIVHPRRVGLCHRSVNYK